MSKKIDLAGFFEKGFEKKDWLNVSQMDLPVDLKFLGVDDFDNARFGKTKRYTFETSDGREARLLCKGATFFEAVENYVSIGDIISISKNDKRYWVITDIKKKWK